MDNQQKKILIVEDDQFLREFYQELLTAEGYFVDVAPDGEIALSKLRSNEYNLVLLDLMLPKLNGIDVLKKIKKDPNTKNLSVIVLTNLDEDAIIKNALKLGANAYLVKIDYTPQQIIDMVRQYIDFRQHLKKQKEII